MNANAVINVLKSQNFRIVGLPEMNGGKVILTLHDERDMEIARAEIREGNNTLSLTSGLSTQVVTLTSDDIEGVIIQFADNATENAQKIEISDADLEAARLIHEVKTVRLKPEDRLVVTVNQEGVDSRMLDNLRNALLRWIGEKNSNRVMVLVGDIDITKVRKEDDLDNQEKSS